MEVADDPGAPGPLSPGDVGLAFTGPSPSPLPPRYQNRSIDAISVDDATTMGLVRGHAGKLAEILGRAAAVHVTG